MMKTSRLVLWLVPALALLSLLAGCPARTQQKNGAHVTGQETPATAEPVSKYRESPVLKARVEAGELPPVEERLPKEPLVVQPAGGVGRYQSETGD